MSDQPLTWTRAGKYVSSLRGQNLHIVDPSAEDTLRAALVPAGFSFAVLEGTGTTSKENLVAALQATLRAPDSCGLGFDALSDCLGDLAV